MIEPDKKHLVKSHERVDDLLVNGLVIIQNPEAFCFGCDAVELANFVTGGSRDRAFDLGAGTGIITLLLGGKKNVRCTGVEIQPDMADMARRSIELNGLGDKCDIVCARMQDVKTYAEAGEATIVVSNPPYMKKASGFSVGNASVAVAREEVEVTLSEVIATAAYLLSTGGAFYMVHRADRMAEIMHECIAAKLEPKILQILTPNEGKNPHLLLIKCVKDAKSGIIVLPERVVDTWV